MATRPEPEAMSITRRPAPASGWSSRYRASAWPPAQAKAQNGGSRPVRPVARSVCCHTPIGSLAWYSRISGTSGTGPSVVPGRMIAGEDGCGNPGSGGGGRGGRSGGGGGRGAAAGEAGAQGGADRGVGVVDLGPVVDVRLQ